MLGAVARLNQKISAGYRLIEKSEYIDRVTPTFSRIPTHRQLVLQENLLKRKRETKIDELA